MEETIRKAIEGDQNAFTLIFLQLQKKLYRIAYNRLKNEFDACDAIQETMIIVYNNLKNINKPESYESWITSILINECKKIYNKKNKVIALNLDDYNDVLIHDNEKSEDEIIFYDMLKGLTEKEQIILILYFQNNYTSKKISEILDIKDNTIKSIIKRAKSKLKKNFKGVVNE